MSIYEASITNPKKQLEFYKDLSEQLQRENKNLKKQLENKYEKVGTLTGELLYEENTKLINQQKDFIKYLEKRYKDITSGIGSYGSNTDMLYGKKDMIEEIFQKYQEIIGEKYILLFIEKKSD